MDNHVGFFSLPKSYNGDVNMSGHATLIYFWFKLYQNSDRGTIMEKQKAENVLKN